MTDGIKRKSEKMLWACGSKCPIMFSPMWPQGFRNSQPHLHPHPASVPKHFEDLDAWDAADQGGGLKHQVLDRRVNIDQQDGNNRRAEKREPFVQSQA